MPVHIPSKFWSEEAEEPAHKSIRKALLKAGGKVKRNKLGIKKNRSKTAKHKPINTKVGTVMSEFKHGKLHSGSKKGPQVTNPKQAVAIALSESRKKRK